MAANVCSGCVSLHHCHGPWPSKWSTELSPSFTIRTLCVPLFTWVRKSSITTVAYSALPTQATAARKARQLAQYRQ